MFDWIITILSVLSETVADSRMLSSQDMKTYEITTGDVQFFVLSPKIATGKSDKVV